jgi:hypothetical protein
VTLGRNVDERYVDAAGRKMFEHGGAARPS